MPPYHALAALLAAAIALAPLAVPPLGRPSWTPGDTWTYRTNTTLSPGLNLTGTATWTVQGRAPTPSGNSSVDAYQVLLSGSGTAAGQVALSSGNVSLRGAWLLTGEERFDPVGLQPLSDLLDLSVNGTYQGVLPFSIRVQNTTTYEILAGDWAYPHAAGSTGRLTVGFNFTQDFSLNGPASMSSHDQGTGTWTETLSVGAPVPVTTPAGTFDAYPITEAWPDGSVQVSFAAPQAGNDVRTESYAPGGNLTAVAVLTSYRYQALEAPTFLGLNAMEWGLLGTAAAVVAAVALVLRRRRRRREARADPTSSPRGP